MSKNKKDLAKLTNEITLYEKKNIDPTVYLALRKELLNSGPLNIIQLVAHFKQFNPSADITTVEEQLSRWPHYFRETDNGLWEGVPIEYSKKGSNKAEYVPGKKTAKKSNKREYKPKTYSQPSNNQRVYKDNNDSHFLVIESDTYKRIGPYLKVEAQSVTENEKDILTGLFGKEDLIKVFLKNKDKYLFLGHRSILNHEETSDGKGLTLKFAPASDDLSIYQISDNSTGLIDHTEVQQSALALPFEAPVPLTPQIIEKIDADYRIGTTNFQLFKDRYVYEFSRLNKKEITAEEFLHWLAEEKSGASQADYEKILRNLMQKNEFKNRLQLLEIAIQCLNDDSSIEFCNDYLDLIIKNKNPDPNFKERAICFVDVLLLNEEKLDKKHYRKIARAYAQNGEWNRAACCYAQAYAGGLNKNDLDIEFRNSLEKCDYEDVKDSIEILFKGGLLKAFEDKINDDNSDEVFDLVTSFYKFYKDKVKPDQNDLEVFASSVLTTCAVNNEWDNFDLFYDDIEAREKFMKKPEKKFDLLSVGEMSVLKDFIAGLSRKYLVLININFDKITEALKQDLIEQVRIFESLMGSSDSSLSDWLQRLRKESKSNEPGIETKDLLKGLKNIFIIGGREATRKRIQERLRACGADKVESVPPMSEKHMDKQSLRAKMSSFDCVVLLTNFMGHAESYMGKGVASEKGIQVVHCHGGISRLLVELGKLRR